MDYWKITGLFQEGGSDQSYQITGEMSKMRSESLKAGFGLMKVPDGLDESSFNGVKEEKV